MAGPCPRRRLGEIAWVVGLALALVATAWAGPEPTSAAPMASSTPDADTARFPGDSPVPAEAPALGHGLQPVASPSARWPGDFDVSGPAAPSALGLRAQPDGLGGSAVGLASWYSDRFQGRATASGEPYARQAFTAAHRTLPMGTLLEVSNPDTGERVVVRINDRGPFHSDRLIDLSRAAAQALGLVNLGVARVELRRLSDQEAADHLRRRLAQVAADAAATAAANGSAQARALTHLTSRRHRAQQVGRPPSRTAGAATTPVRRPAALPPVSG